MATKKVVKYVAVVGADRPSGRFEGGDWASFVGTDKDETIRRALRARRDWGTRDYVVWVGTLTELVTIPNNWKLVAI